MKRHYRHSSPLGLETSFQYMLNDDDLTRRDRFEYRFVIMNFFFDSPYVTQVTKDAKMSVYDKLVSLNCQTYLRVINFRFYKLYVSDIKQLFSSTFNLILQAN